MTIMENQLPSKSFDYLNDSYDMKISKSRALLIHKK